MDYISIFERERHYLTGLAYGLLGSMSDAEDAVQETFLKWQSTDHEQIENPAAWLTSVCTRQSLDNLKAAHRARTDYFGVWLPEPVPDENLPTPEDHVALASSLSLAFLLALERLTPKERAAYLLKEIFDQDYSDVSGVLSIQEPACRKLVSRAKSNISEEKLRHRTPEAIQLKLVAAFKEAVTTGNTDGLSQLLVDDIRLHADGGGIVPAIYKVQSGIDVVVPFIPKFLSEFWRGCEWQLVDINATKGVLLLKEGEVFGVLTFGFTQDNKASDIFIVRNPEKLKYFKTMLDRTAGRKLS
ncbi:RNA polymerase subunit sigma-24 [Sneathiella sp. P13V-1]|uniref:sigma factor n=1 Tax=Sneathiella sp. P13V-1 TaxID=2697366 RepID=UPI00187B7FEB|nr:sigma factor [Sneathiella sp. P13V-1]MBE7638220.1 RNA polymerase subunit sigma-24 [Sneathiella sp. P13V-1]